MLNKNEMDYALFERLWDDDFGKRLPLVLILCRKACTNLTDEEKERLLEASSAHVGFIVLDPTAGSIAGLPDYRSEDNFKLWSEGRMHTRDYVRSTHPIARDWKAVLLVNRSALTADPGQIAAECISYLAKGKRRDKRANGCLLMWL